MNEHFDAIIIGTGTLRTLLHRLAVPAPSRLRG